MSSRSNNPTRSFLMAMPRPARIRCVLANAEIRLLEVGSAPQWKRLAETVEALVPQTIELLDAAGALIRARNPELAQENEPEDEEEDPTEPVEGDVPFETFARLLADAHKATGERAFQFVETAFSRMVDIVNSQTRRMDQMERVVDGMHRVWRKSFEQSLEQAGDEAASEGTTLQQMLQAFLSGQAQAAVKSATGGHTNGKPGG